MAREGKEKAIGIILSGLLDDGLKGSKAIEENGGMVMVQDPDTADKDSMPLNVILKDHPNHILAPEKMAEVLMNFISIDHDK